MIALDDEGLAENEGNSVMAKKIKKTETPVEPEVVSYKGFGLDWKCRDYQFKIGETYEHNGPVEVCASGFHACEYPLDVFGYYPPGISKYAEVRQGGTLARHNDDSKVASARLTVIAELSIPEIVTRAIKWITDRCTPEGEVASGYQGAASSTGDRGAASSTGHQGAASSTGDRGAASSTGDQGAASSTGYQGAASSTGHQGAASSTGTRGAASSTGDRGAASSTGDQGAASSTGTRGAAMASGCEGRAQGANGNALFLVHRANDGAITHAWAGIVGRNGIKPFIWYSLGADGKPKETTP